jgi:hypothetical protein
MTWIGRASAASLVLLELVFTGEPIDWLSLLVKHRHDGSTTGNDEEVNAILKIAKETGVEDLLPKVYRWDAVVKKEVVELLDFYKKVRASTLLRVR